MFEEIATFLDVDQFVIGKTQFACGFFANRQVWNSAPTGQKPPRTPGDITALALADYTLYDGSDGANNEEGMSKPAFYDDLKRLSLPYREVPVDSQAVAHIRGYLALKWPVIVTLAEASVLDKQLGACPYPWPPRYNHIIALTGQGPQAQEVLARDCANVDSRWVLRAGPRLYDASVMRLELVTAVQMPYSLDTPVESHPTAPTTLPAFSPSADDLQLWHLVQGSVPMVAEHAIPQSWLKARWEKGYDFGPPFENEHMVMHGGVMYMEQQFSGARASWNSSNNQVTWWTPNGPIVI